MIRFEGALALTTYSPTELPKSAIKKIVAYAKVNPNLVPTECKTVGVASFIGVVV